MSLVGAHGRFSDPLQIPSYDLCGEGNRELSDVSIGHAITRPRKSSSTTSSAHHEVQSLTFR